MPFTHIDKPFRIKNLELKNRVVRSAHTTNIGNGRISDDLIAYHEARARGGVALSLIEQLSVHRSSAGLLDSWTPGLGDGYKKLIDACRPHGMRLFQQIWHGGINSVNADGGPPWAPSDIASSKYCVVPVQMTQGMIDEVIAAYASTARKCEEWGLDGVEVHCAHGYLPHQFLSSAYNNRTDKYGGSVENRARFIIETVDAVRKAVSKNFIVGVRISPDYQVGSLPTEDVVRTVQMLEERDLIDFVDVSAGNYQTDYKMVGGMHEPVGYQMESSVPVVRTAKTPTIVAGRFRTLDDADLVIREGNADLVVMTRATIADPELVAKSLAGNGTKVRPCIGCNQACVGGVMRFVDGGYGRSACTVNPATGFELTRGDSKLHRASKAKKVLIVGGGVAGMEAARTAALCGHKVILAEADSHLGGAVNIAAKLPTRHGIHDIAVWQEQEIFALSVEVRLSTYMEIEDVEREAPDAVIVATGSLPRLDGVQLNNPGEPILGMNQPHVLSSLDLLTLPGRNLGRAAVVDDDVGHYEAMGVAEFLLDKGLEVTFVTRNIGIGHQLDGAFMTTPTLQRFDHSRFTLYSRSRIVSISNNSVVIAPVYVTNRSNSERKTIPADTVVVVSYNRPNRELFDALGARNIPAQIIGDAQIPRTMEDAIREGYLAGASV